VIQTTTRANVARKTTTKPDRTPVEADLDLLEFAAHLRVSVTRLARLLRQLDTEGLSPSQSAALATIERLGPITLGDLAAIERIAKPTVSAVVGKLEDRDYVRRLTDAVDGRICRVELTDVGRDHLLSSRSRRTTWLVEQFDRCSPDELASLRAAIGVLDLLSVRPEMKS